MQNFLIISGPHFGMCISSKILYRILIKEDYILYIYA